MKNPHKILITGASSGLGKALAVEYANSQNILFLSGRNKQRLQEVAKLCEAKQAQVISKVIDVKNKAEMAKWIEEIADKYGLDLVIANAGISAGTSSGVESDEQIAEVFQTNIDGVLNTVNPAVKLMQKQGKGQIAIMSSLAGFRGLPSSPSYSASKAAVRVYGEGLRGFLAKFNVQVNVICPGYVKTPMTDVNKFPMPFLVEAPKAAKIIKKALIKNKSRITFPFALYFTVWLATLLSPTITDPIFAKLPGKESLTNQ
ncbi:MAG: SDR family NAD(P)-dependent oxidoreductase [Proteobacteria bacterium]|nr:SDR family NAD(P)-dependent oxidoreductase [Pseudomonadota bacterium]